MKTVLLIAVILAWPVIVGVMAIVERRKK